MGEVLEGAYDPLHGPLLCRTHAAIYALQGPERTVCQRLSSNCEGVLPEGYASWRSAPESFSVQGRSTNLIPVEPGVAVGEGRVTIESGRREKVLRGIGLLVT